MLALIAFWEKGSAQSGDSSTRSNPNQSAIRTSVPTLPGSWTPSRARVTPCASAPAGRGSRRTRPIASTADGVGKWLIRAMSAAEIARVRAPPQSGAA